MAFALSPQNLAKASARHPWRTIGIWAVLFVVSFMAVGALLKDATTTEAKITSNVESNQGRKLLEDRLRGPFRSQEAVIIESGSRTVEDPAFKSYAQGIYEQIKALGPEKSRAPFRITTRRRPPSSRRTTRRSSSR